MEHIIEYEIIDISNEKHRQFLEELWKDRGVKEYYGNKKKSISEFINSFNNEYTNQYEKIVKTNNIYIGWTRVLPIGDDFEVECIILKKYRGNGFGKAILKDLIDKNYSIILNIKKSNYSALKSIKSFPFREESRNNDAGIIKSGSNDAGILTYKLEKNKYK